MAHLGVDLDTGRRENVVDVAVAAREVVLGAIPAYEVGTKADCQMPSHGHMHRG